MQAQGFECFTRSDTLLFKHSFTVSKNMLDPEFKLSWCSSTQLSALATQASMLRTLETQGVITSGSAQHQLSPMAERPAPAIATKVVLESEELVSEITYFPKCWLLLTGIALITAGLSQH